MVLSTDQQSRTPNYPHLLATKHQVPHPPPPLQPAAWSANPAAVDGGGVEPRRGLQQHRYGGGRAAGGAAAAARHSMVKRRPFFLNVLKEASSRHRQGTRLTRQIDVRHLVLDHLTISRFKWLHNLAIFPSISVTT
jgi:hypothetical protein